MDSNLITEQARNRLFAKIKQQIKRRIKKNRTKPDVRVIGKAQRTILFKALKVVYLQPPSQLIQFDLITRNGIKLRMRINSGNFFKPIHAGAFLFLDLSENHEAFPIYHWMSTDMSSTNEKVLEWLHN